MSDELEDLEVPEINESVVSDEGEDPIAALASIDKEGEVTPTELGSITDEEGNEICPKIGAIRPNEPPKKHWSDNPKNVKFRAGDFVYMKIVKYRRTHYKVVAPGIKPNTYEILPSESNKTTIVNGNEITHSPKHAHKLWKCYYEATSPFNIPGIKISCPSNDKFKVKK
jgi:hypothetical protein